ncbi:uncharacterized protein LOC126213214 isoform X2 [Schistocerca nitens]|uniref:uncharacterized protein LOC126213214 isoform X2 n=1 Tax=Schistocerca nitens TaxID=7011 RepID=UPI0021195740|nr:uncharacterized protein LOC126213214 isoform X2 [Schistocerca nitens]
MAGRPTPGTHSHPHGYHGRTPVVAAPPTTPCHTPPPDEAAIARMRFSSICCSMASSSLGVWHHLGGPQSSLLMVKDKTTGQLFQEDTSANRSFI